MGQKKNPLIYMNTPEFYDIARSTKRGLLYEVHIADIHFGAMDPIKEYQILYDQFILKISTLPRIDIIAINGDIFDRKMMANSPAIYYAIKFVSDVIAVAKIHRAAVIMTVGTPSHEAGQYNVLYQFLNDPDVEVYIVDQLKYVYTHGAKILCIPELHNEEEAIYAPYYLKANTEQKRLYNKIKEQNESIINHKKEIEELRRISGGRLKISGTKKRTTAGVQISDDPLDFRRQIDYFSSLNEQNLHEAAFHAKGLWGYIALAYSTEAQKDYDHYENLCSNTENLLTGGKPPAYDEKGFTTEFIKKFPVEARDAAIRINQEISQKKEELIEKRKMLEGGEEYRKSESDFDRGILAVDKIIEDFDLLRARNQLVINDSMPKIMAYENLLKDADEQYNLAIAAFKKENFDGANAAVDLASEKYAGALDIEYSEKIRAMREETLNELALKIQRAEYEKVLREVFALKDKAAIAYYSSSFDAAENLLVMAQSRWAKVSTDPDSEIEDMLNIVKTIKSIEYGRVLLQSDPHYPELSYSLDMAKQAFERGLLLKKQGNADGAREAFNLSLTNIRNVQNVYPLNKEARLITLKIQQELDPEGFPRQFENQYNAARLNSNKNERLADLEDLYAVNPKYPGLAQEIYEIKDSLGMFPKKEVRKEVKKSAESKIAEAKKAFKEAGSNEARLNRALALANEAIAIDGSSKSAKELKLQIQLKIGASSTAILSQNDEKMYAEAARLFNQRRFADAKEIMDNLLKGAAAKRSRKVIDLNNRLLKRL